MAARRGAPRVGGVGAILDRGSRWSVGDARPPASPASPGVTTVLEWAGSASRAAVPRWPGGRSTESVGALRDARLASRTRGRARPVGRKATIRWSPSGEGSRPQDSCVGTQQGRARREQACPPRRGRPPPQPRCSAVPPTQPRSPRKALDANARDHPRRRDRWRRAFRRGVSGTARPSPTSPTRSTPRNLGAGSGAARLSTRSTSTPRLLDLALGTVMSMSGVWTTAGPHSAERSTAGCSWSRYAPYSTTGSWSGR
jgi:hypothetical protein